MGFLTTAGEAVRLCSFLSLISQLSTHFQLSLPRFKHLSTGGTYVLSSSLLISTAVPQSYLSNLDCLQIWPCLYRPKIGHPPWDLFSLNYCSLSSKNIFSACCHQHLLHQFFLFPKCHLPQQVIKKMADIILTI